MTGDEALTALIENHTTHHVLIAALEAIRKRKPKNVSKDDSYEWAMAYLEDHVNGLADWLQNHSESELASYLKSKVN